MSSTTVTDTQPWQFLTNGALTWPRFWPGMALEDQHFHNLNVYQAALTASLTPPPGLRATDYGLIDGTVTYMNDQLTLKNAKLRTDKGFLICVEAPLTFPAGDGDCRVCFGFTRQFEPAYAVVASNQPGKLAVDIGALAFYRRDNGYEPDLANMRLYGGLSALQLAIHNLSGLFKVMPLAGLKAGTIQDPNQDPNQVLARMLSRRTLALKELLSDSTPAGSLSVSAVFDEIRELAHFAEPPTKELTEEIDPTPLLVLDRTTTGLNDLKAALVKVANYQKVHELIERIQEPVRFVLKKPNTEGARREAAKWHARAVFVPAYRGVASSWEIEWRDGEPRRNQLICAWSADNRVKPRVSKSTPPDVPQPPQMNNRIDERWAIFWRENNVKQCTITGADLVFKLDLPNKVPDEADNAELITLPDLQTQQF